MSNPFQEQFLKAGLTNKKKVKQAQHNQRIKAKQKRKGEIDALDESQKRAIQAAKEKAEKDRLLNRQRDEQAQQKAIIAQIKQLIESNIIQPEKETSPYHFQDGKKVKQIDVDEVMRSQLVAGNLCIARFDEGYFIIPKRVADKIADRNPDYIIVANTQEQQQDEDDPYADYVIPDDLMW